MVNSDFNISFSDHYHIHVNIHVIASFVDVSVVFRHHFGFLKTINERSYLDVNDFAVVINLVDCKNRMHVTHNSFNGNISTQVNVLNFIVI